MTEAPRPTLKVADLRKSYATAGEELQVLAGVSLGLEGGESMAITGPSGSGKSTLLHILGGLEPPTAGSVELAGENPYHLGPRALAAFRNRKIGFVFQDHHLLPQLNVLENVLVPALAGGGIRREIEDWARELLSRVGMAGRLEHRPAELSGGEKQRAAIARALIHKPLLLLCDEPTGNLDAATAGKVRDLFLELNRELGGILIAVTHSLDLAARFDRRAELVCGRLRAAIPGSP